jgi:hypothetical protein
MLQVPHLISVLHSVDRVTKEPPSCPVRVNDARRDHLLSLEFVSLSVGFEFFTAMTINHGVFWDVTPCGSCKDRRFGGT